MTPPTVSTANTARVALLVALLTASWPALGQDFHWSGACRSPIQMQRQAPLPQHYQYMGTTSYEGWCTSPKAFQHTTFGHSGRYDVRNVMDDLGMTRGWRKWGADRPCDTNTPLGQALNAISLVHSAARVPEPWHHVDRRDGVSILRWAPAYVRRHIWQLEPDCSSFYARTGAAFVRLGRRYFWHGADKFVWRAATLVHEARHSEGCVHNGNDGNGRCSGGSCDETISNGCKSGTRPGANAYQYRWLRELAVEPGLSPRTVTSVMRHRARDDANHLANCLFDTHPMVQVTNFGTDDTPRFVEERPPVAPACSP